ncbi:MAG: hypothetical protein D8M57_01000 [Candidatus Scalindua sp. AMX11]|nr:MAG: hypothetical protein DWQ00_14980 [Candidatus Scalindua sp.]TDE66646.1 MAG: hypothetical protein D8M57_01000 [Candidatus Scalindua sp. AMX11]
MSRIQLQTVTKSWRNGKDFSQYLFVFRWTKFIIIRCYLFSQIGTMNGIGEKKLCHSACKVQIKLRKLKKES